MKRVALRILLFLLIGAVINVAVAWWLAHNRLWSSEVLWLQDEAAARKGWPAEVPASWGLPNVWTEYSSVGHTEVHVVTGAYRIDPPRFAGGETLVIESAGWPLRSMKSTRFEEFEGSSNTSAVGVRYRFVSSRIGMVREEGFKPSGMVRSVASMVEYLPVFPIWTGLLVNSIVYGAVACLALAVPRVGIRFFRQRRGLCAHCAYPVGTSAVCSECGRAVKPRQVGA